MARVVFHGVHHECGSCGGRLVGLVPFQEELVPEDAARVWRLSEEGTAVGRCPFCDGELRAPDGEAGTGGLAVCRRCQQVWVPKAAAPWMEAHAAHSKADAPASQPSHPDSCPSCGAPYSPDANGDCRYCRAELADPVPVLVAVPSEKPFVEGPSVGGVAGAVVDSILDLFLEH
jgi:hypothetical protein